ncbi:hypothetical protein FPOAC2_08020 [Fusarium poae]
MTTTTAAATAEPQMPIVSVWGWCLSCVGIVLIAFLVVLKKAGEKNRSEYPNLFYGMGLV